MATKTKQDKKLERDITFYSIEWARTMETIWRDRINRLGVVYTRALLESVKGFSVSQDGTVTVIFHRFLQYGIFVDMGVGNGYTRGNGGYLEALDRNSSRYRRDRPKHRERRQWYSKPRYSSIMNLRDDLARMVGEAFLGAFDVFQKK